MNVAFIICEYNPFHNGHLYHINETRRGLSPDAVVCVMSGNYTQRGSPAIVDKWARAKMALLCGADLVVELHTVHACSSAEYFALGAIKAIDDFSVGGALSFGVETPDPGLFYEMSSIFENEGPKFKETLSLNLKQGMSFAKARALAAEGSYFAARPESRGGADIRSFLKSPNNILALEYIRAISRLGSNLKPFMVKRAASSHNDRKMSGIISSATSIRHRLSLNMDSAAGGRPAFAANGATPGRREGAQDDLTVGAIPDSMTGAAQDNTITGATQGNMITGAPTPGNTITGATTPDNTIRGAMPESLARALDDDIRGAMPESVAGILATEISSGRGILFDEDFFQPLLVTLRRMAPIDAEGYSDVSEGLAGRIIAASQVSGTFDELMENIKTKRYPATRVRRILTHILLGITKTDLRLMGFPGGCPYIRVLGFTQAGQKLLSSVRGSARVPIITNYSKARQFTGHPEKAYVDVEIKATDIYSAFYKDPASHKGGHDFTRGVIIV